MAADILVTGAEVLALDTIRISFSEPLANGTELEDVANYSITGDGVAVMVIDALPSSDSFVSDVVLVTTRPTLGAEYTVTVDTTLASASGDTIDPANATALFLARITKMDSFLEKQPKMYTRSHRSNLRLVMQAIMREDELIGGEGI